MREKETPQSPARSRESNTVQVLSSGCCLRNRFVEVIHYESIALKKRLMFFEMQIFLRGIAIAAYNGWRSLHSAVAHFVIPIRTPLIARCRSMPHSAPAVSLFLLGP